MATASPPAPPNLDSKAATANRTPPPGGAPVGPARVGSDTVPSASSPVSQAGKAIEVRQAEKLQAPEQDVRIAKASAPIEQRPDPARKADIDDLERAVRSPDINHDGRDHNGHDWNRPDPMRDDRHDHDWDHHDHDWDHPVRQWDSRWVDYDDYYRPIICNPYHDELRVIYIYEYEPRIVVIPPLASVVLGALDYGAYNFTALLFDPVGTALNVAVGSFFGGGYDTGPFLAPPPPLLTYDDVPVFVNYHQAQYEPFVARRIVDAGDDARYGEHKVLLDGVTPVWGNWTQTPDGQRQFEVHKTQQFPGLDDPREGPLPGDYQLRLADKSSGFSSRDVFVVAAAAVVTTLGLCGAIALAVSRRRARALH
ncbi:hypothetical protein [Mycobacterium sp.]|uniref:hypothetical protein n=1 Tax=Mycobacterium sp. TaxID=1785 RepID=UPI002D3A8EA4|nr:hypothetical protein [Mycobacterium sp.]HZA10317.1 hypothetical protein [Mycobacterium sp.]